MKLINTNNDKININVIMRDRNGGKPNNGQRCPLFGIPPPQPAPAH